MAYTKTTWVDGQAPAISAENLNKMETQYDQALADAATATATATYPLVSGSDITAGAMMHAGELAAARVCSMTGHSLMYGMDTTAAGTGAPVNGAGLSRSVFPTPERFVAQAAYTSPGSVTITNQSYPGDRSTEALVRWAGGSSGNMEFIWIDVNDGLSSAAGPALSDTETAANFRDLIKRARGRGADVVVIGGSPGDSDANSRKIFASAQANRAVAERYGARYVDAGELLSALPKSLTLFSSGIHFTKEGYNLVGQRLAALLGPKGTNPPTVSPGRIITPRDGLHVLRSGGTTAVRAGSADGTVWSLPATFSSVALSVEVVEPCIPLIRLRVNGTAEGFGTVGIYSNTGGSGRSTRFANVVATNSQSMPGFAYVEGAPLMSPGPDSVVVLRQTGSIDVDSIEFIPIRQGLSAAADGSYDQKRSKRVQPITVGGGSTGRVNATWDAAFDTCSGISTLTGSAGATKLGASWLFDLALGANNSGVVLAQSVYAAPVPTAAPWGFGQGYMFLRSGTSLIVRKLDNGTATDATVAGVFSSATGTIRCAFEIFYDSSADQFVVFVDGVQVTTVATPGYGFYMAGLVAGAAASGGYASGSGVVSQKASTVV